MALVITSSSLLLAVSPPAHASIAYGSLNNFDCVNDTGVQAHGFEIELDDVHSTDITYTYDYNHYGVPKITQDNSDPAHPKVFVRYAATRDSSGNWSAFTAVPSGPITPTDGHQFTNPSVNFGGEHFGVGYYGAPTAVKYNWLIDDGFGNLVHGPPVNVATPTFTYNPPVAAQPAQVQAVIVPPPPPVLPAKQFGEATWVKDIKTTTHNANKVELRDLVDPDPDNPAAKNWANGEPAEVETEWRILQTDFTDAGNPKGELKGAAQDLPGGDEVVTRRYEFYKYTGPLDEETGEAVADTVGPDGIHGDGSVTYADYFDFGAGEWHTTTVDTSTLEIVGDFIGAQMAGFDVAPALGLIDHIPDGELGVAYADRTVVVAGAAAFEATISSGSPPDGTTLGKFTGVFSGTPTAAGVFTFTVDAADTSGASVSKTYTVTIPAGDGGAPVQSTITTSASPVAGGSTAGDGTFDNGTPVTVVATHSPGYGFVNWTEGGVQVSASAVYPFTVNANRTLVANFVPAYTITTSASPGAGGSTSGDGTFNSGDSVTVQASANAGYYFVNWTEGGANVSSSASYTFTASANRTLVANFSQGQELTALSPADIWVGLRNSDDVGTRFDLRAEVYADGALIGSGLLNGVNGGSSGFNNASLNSIPLTLIASVDVGAGSSLSIKLSVRNTCSGKTHNSGTARLWFNDAQADSGFDATIGGTTSEYYLVKGSALASAEGSGPKMTSDVFVNSKAACPGRPFTPFGTWSITLE